MNRHLVTLIDATSACCGCHDVRLAQRQQPTGMPVTFADAHDQGRERHDINLSGEGPG